MSVLRFHQGHQVLADQLFLLGVDSTEAIGTGWNGWNRGVEWASEVGWCIEAQFVEEDL